MANTDGPNGQGKLQAQYRHALHRAWQDRRLVLFLGAGVSQPYGVPTWNDLVLDLLLQNFSEFRIFWPHYRRALASWLTENFNFSPTTLARIIKKRLGNDAQYLKSIHDSLYRVYHDSLRGGPVQPPREPTALTAIAQLIERSEAEGRPLPAVLTTNFDSLLEVKLGELNARPGARPILFRPVYDPSRTSAAHLPIIHVHGYVPYEAELLDGGRKPREKSPLIFSEDEYHSVAHSGFYWSLVDIASYLRGYTVLFVGLSMTDPNLRRLLDATYVKSDDPAHFLLYKDHQLPDKPDERQAIGDEIQRRAKIEGKRLNRTEEKKNPRQLFKAVELVLNQARDYNRELFESMGVGVVWFEDYGDIPGILKGIVEHAPDGCPDCKKAKPHAAG